MTFMTPNRGFQTPYRFSHCTSCLEVAAWHNRTLVVPRVSTIPAPPADLPPDCSTDYEEAREIFQASPRGAAALLRLVIQKLMIHLGLPGNNINADIGTLVQRGLSPRVQQALDVCRVVGNNAVHPGSLDLNADPEIAHSLFGLINFIVEDQITRPAEVESLFKGLPDGARDAIEKRDAPKT
jgi:Domain of unknown function (DUF4145)